FVGRALARQGLEFDAIRLFYGLKADLQVIGFIRFFVGRALARQGLGFGVIRFFDGLKADLHVIGFYHFL
ncbi:hypothetical protein, partial [Marinomonas polaris]|uniref:hypothetical protein n=1 Tax=Marinomonas polaris TaxID=293552 RepID=UPI003F94E0A9